MTKISLGSFMDSLLPSTLSRKSIHPALMNQKTNKLMRNKMSACRKAAVTTYYGKYA